VCFIAVMVSINLQMAATAQQKPPRRSRPAPPARDPKTPGYVPAQELPDGTLPRGPMSTETLSSVRRTSVPRR
jgi:hypothetical protein